MKTTTLPFSNSLIIPGDTERMKTSELMEAGPIFSMRYPGMVHYMPIGNMIIERLRNLVKHAHASMGSLEVKIPNYMKRGLLDSGEKVEKTFADKFVILPDPMGDYMILTTHEMELLDWLKGDGISYKSLPIRISFTKGIFRPIKNPKRILKLREVEVQAMLSLDADQSGFENSLQEYANACESIFEKLQIGYVKQVSKTRNKTSPHSGFDLEYFYKSEEGENVSSPSDGIKEKVLSLSMGYKYAPLPEFIRVTNQKNQLADPVVGTYAMGLERLLFASFDSSRDQFGFDIPEAIRPFDSSVLVFGDEKELYQKAKKIYESLSQEGKTVLFDDRPRAKRVEKARLSDYLGIPTKIIVSKSGIRSLKRKEIVN